MVIYCARSVKRVSDRRFPPNRLILIMICLQVMQAALEDRRGGPDIIPAATGYRTGLLYFGSETAYMKTVLNEAPGY